MKKKIKLDPTVFLLAAEQVFDWEEYACTAIQDQLGDKFHARTWRGVSDVRKAEESEEKLYFKFFTENFCPTDVDDGDLWWDARNEHGKFNDEPRIFALLLCAEIIRDSRKRHFRRGLKK